MKNKHFSYFRRKCEIMFYLKYKPIKWLDRSDIELFWKFWNSIFRVGNFLSFWLFFYVTFRDCFAQEAFITDVAAAGRESSLSARRFEEKIQRLEQETAQTRCDLAAAQIRLKDLEEKARRQVRKGARLRTLSVFPDFFRALFFYQEVQRVLGIFLLYFQLLLLLSMFCLDRLDFCFYN